MDYCLECGAMLVRVVDGGYICSCGARVLVARRVQIETFEGIKELEVVDQTVHLLATHDHVCSKCGFAKAQLVTKGVSYGDEDDHFAYVCGKCGHHDVLEGKLK